MKKFSQEEHSFKELSYSNWINIDEFNRINVEREKGIKFVSISEAEWFEKLYRINVDVNVPKDIQNLIEFTIGTMTYGYFYYPVFALAFERLFSIVDTALNKKCKLLLAPKTKYSYKQKVNWLFREGAISHESHEIWERVVQLRDVFYNPQKQNTVPLYIILHTVNSLILLINDLYNYREKPIGTIATGYVLTYESIPFSGFSQNGAKALFNQEPHIFTNLPAATKMRTKLKIVIKNNEDVEGLEKITTPIHLVIAKIYN